MTPLRPPATHDATFAISTLRDRPAVAPGSRRRAGSGFTLVELLVVIAVATIIATGAVASFSTTAAGYRMLSEANGLVRDLQFARAEALKRGSNVALCPSSDGTTCLTGSAWQTGWLVFVDANGNGSFGTGDTLLRWVKQTPGNASFMADNSVSSLVFNRQGALAALPANPVTLTLHDAAGNTALTRCVALVPSGRASVQLAGVGNCT